jgi:hypothetical protein
LTSRPSSRANNGSTTNRVRVRLRHTRTAAATAQEFRCVLTRSIASSISAVLL